MDSVQYSKNNGRLCKIIGKKEIDPMTYEGRHCEVKSALAIEDMIVGKKVNFQVKIHEAMSGKKSTST